MARKRLPGRREALTISIIHPGTENHTRPVTYDISMGFPDGIPERDPKEVFISCNRVTTALDVAARDIATLISIAMQHGAMVDELAAAMTRDDQGGVNSKSLQNAIEKARTFLAAAAEVRVEKSAYGGDHLYLNGPRETGACKRASMDLSRALADMRRPG